MNGEASEAGRSGEESGEELEAFMTLDTRPIDPGHAVLRKKFFERYADQAQQMDALGQQMIKVELAVPGIYAAVLALLQGQSATLGSGWLVVGTFACWFVSMLLTFASLFPRNYRVDSSVLVGEEPKLGMATFFRKSATYKRRMLLIAALVFWLGIAGALWLIVGPVASGTP